MSYETVIQSCHEKMKSLNRPPTELKILAVSKLQPVEKIVDLYNKGQRVFGENYVQEALAKQESLKNLSIEWHLIGSLQRKKVRLVVGRFQLIHSVDSMDLAVALSESAKKSKITQKILIQINLANEPTKGGFDPDSVTRNWPELCELSGIEITGLMTMPPLTEDPEAVRVYFKELSKLKDQLQKLSSGRYLLRELSMGTSHDYNVAIEEGATIVRLGTILFGERPKKN